MAATLHALVNALEDDPYCGTRPPHWPGGPLRLGSIQEIIATTVDQYADALLQTHVGPLAKLTDQRAQIRPEDTLGDLAARSHPDYRRGLHNQTRSAVAATGQAARDIASLSAELKHTTERLRAAIALTQAEVNAVR